MFQVTAALLAASVSGVVLDPQDLTVRDARVELQCANQAEVATTDEEGKFTVVAATEDGCVLTITRDGFAPFRQGVDRHGGPVVVRLTLAPVQQRVDVVAPQPARTPPSFGSVFLSADAQNLRALGPTTADLIRYAQLMAGTTTRPADVYVDGLPARSLPPLDAIAHISINGDPFSAEYADADVSSIEIITKTPSRKVRLFMGGDMPGVDGRDVLAPSLKSRSRFVNLGLMGPVPHAPLTFSASGGVSRSSQEMPIQAALPDLGDRARADTTANRHESGSLSLHYAPGTSVRVRGSFRESRAHGTNDGIGGVTLREAGFSSFYGTRDSRVTATHVSSRLLYEGGVAATSNDSQSRANSLEPGVTVGGDVVMGGAPVSDARRTATRWTTKHVVRSRSVRPWTLGAIVAGTHDANRNTPNRAGAYYFADIPAYRDALAGARTGTWSVARGTHTIRFASQTAAAFAQTELIRRGELALSGGLRGDYQSGLGIIMSPRVSLAGRWRDIGVRAGIGMFVQRVPEQIFLTVRENDGFYLQQFVANDVSLVAPTDPPLDAVTSIRARLSDALSRPRALQWRISAERPFGALTPALEYSMSDERHLLGSDRLRSDAGWTDVFASDRGAVRHRLHAYTRYAWKGQQFVADYEWARARDNTDGAFSFPERSGNIAAEWARSAGVSPHSVTVMSTLSLPMAISVTIVDNWRSGSPYNITTGRDVVGNGLFLDRGGRGRNSGNGPRFHSVSLYAHRRIELSDVLESLRGVGFNISVQADNILNNTNVLGVGSIDGATTFGQPLAAYPGRSVRVLFGVN